MGLADRIYKKGSFELETNTDGDVDTVKGECLFREVTGGFEFTYKEETADTKIKLTSGRAELERKGEISYKFRLEPEMSYDAVMNTPYGKMCVTVTGEDMMYMPTAKGFDGVLRYYLGQGADKVHIIIALRVKFDK
ncbi:MAG: DUF1934 family protein [Ruminococcus sp.]|nr:DUF1934 family protein [Ruminococcus sp.]